MMRKWWWAAGVVLGLVGGSAGGSAFAAGGDEGVGAGEVSAPIVAQSWGEVTGRVVDAQGAPVHGARVVRLGAEGSETLTDEAGEFRLVVVREDDQPVSLVFEKRAGSEVLHAVERVEGLGEGERRDVGMVTLRTECEPGWTADLFPGAPGVNGAILALAVFDDGSGSGPALYAGGSDFTIAGGVAANRIAKWDGSSWSAHGSGMDNDVWALAVFDDGSGSGPALYAGGRFTSAGGVAANRIAKWDGSSWSALGSGIDGSIVHALTVFDDGSGSGPALYAGGLFTTAGGASANNIAKWDGSSWSAVASGMNGWVWVLTVFDDGTGSGPALYAGGAFTTAGDVPANYVAKWDGVAWSALGSGMNGWVEALAVFDDGSGSGSALYVGGLFTSASGMANTSFIAKWDGSSWSDVGSGMNGWVEALAVFDDGSGSGPALYAGGWFASAGGVPANSIAKWDGSSWSALGTGMTSTVVALSGFDDGSGPVLYAGGYFPTAGDVEVKRIAKWDGSSWTALGEGIDEIIDALTVFDDGSGAGPALYAGGYLTTAGGVPASRIARWDGSSWSALGSGMAGGSLDTAVLALAVFDDGSGSGPALYAGGSFTIAGGVAANGVAKWDGSSWSALGSGITGGSFPIVRALTVFDDGSGSGPALYAGGSDFTIAGGVAANRIAKWDGSSWSALGSGIGGTVRALTVFDDGSGGGPALYAGGSFTTAGGVSTSGIAKWDGSSWSAMGAGLNSEVAALAVFDDGSGSGPALYAGGFFTAAGGVAADRIARWDGSSWSSLGSGMNNNGVFALTVFDDGSGSGPALYAGGLFTTAGGESANNIAKWDGSSWSALGSGMNTTVSALTVFDDGSGDEPALFAGGAFSTAGGFESGYIARWQGCRIATSPCPGDANGDDVIDFNDITTILANWLNDYQPGTGIGDANGDGVVDFNDVTAVLANWLSACP